MDHQFLIEIASRPDLSWQQSVNMVSRHYNLSAALAAQLLDPHYKIMENVRWMSQWSDKPHVIDFAHQMTILVQRNQISWSDAVAHVAKELNISSDKASVLLKRSL